MFKKMIEWLKRYKVDLIGALVVGFALVFLFASGQAVAGQGDIANHVIRLHVLAHDDSDKEQNLKLLVRDGVWTVMNELTHNVRNIDETRQIILENLHVIEDAAWAVLKGVKSEHDAHARLVQGLDFPAMAYGSVLLPQGRYEALQIIIGSGAGSNWWCIMFPPMCLMDVTRGQQIDAGTDEVTLRARFRLFSR